MLTTMKDTGVTTRGLVEAAELERLRQVGRFAPAGVPGLVVLILVAGAVEVEAYIDPGTGSYLFQLAAAGVFAGLFVVKRYWRAIKEKLGSLTGSRKDRDGAEGHDGVD